MKCLLINTKIAKGNMVQWWLLREYEDAIGTKNYNQLCRYFKSIWESSGTVNTHYNYMSLWLILQSILTNIDDWLHKDWLILVVETVEDRETRNQFHFLNEESLNGNI